MKFDVGTGQSVVSCVLGNLVGYVPILLFNPVHLNILCMLNACPCMYVCTLCDKKFMSLIKL